MRNSVPTLFAIGFVLSFNVATTQAQLFDHLKCYKVKDEAKFTVDVNLEALQAEFGMEQCAVKGKGKLFCVPTDKTPSNFVDKSKEGIPPVPFAGQQQTEDRICYKMKCPKVEIDPLQVTDQFGTRNLAKFKPSLLCTPAIKGLPAKRVFVSSTTHLGDLGGGMGALGGDAICQSLADAAALGGTWMAWLSDSSTSPDSRFTHSALPYVLVDGTKVADDWSDLTDGLLDNPINLDENGGAPPASSGHFAGDPTLVWTGTEVDGTVRGAHCSDWSDAGSSSFHMGNRTSTAPNWTDCAICGGGGGSDCGGPAPIYCFEQ
jgi:hypothetical protein